MSRTITRLFDNFSDAERAVAELERLGVPHADISLIGNNVDQAHDHRGAYGAGSDGATADHTADDARKGATTGGLLGAGGGLLAGLGLLAIPGVGPVVAAGWLVSTAVGAAIGTAAGGASGGLIGALKNAGETEGNAEVYAEGVRRGSTLVSAKVDNALADSAAAALSGLRAVDATTRGSVYRQSGWSKFDTNAPAYTSDQVTRERSLYTAR